MESDVSVHIQFEQLYVLFETLCKTPQPAKKRELLRDFYKSFREKASALSKTCPDVNTSFYPVLRLIIPDADRERGPYGLRAIKFARVIINVLSLPPQSTDASRLTKFRTVGNSNVVDFADAAYSILRKKFMNKKDVTIAEVNKSLDAIARKNADNEPRGLEDEVMKLFRLCGTADYLKWIIRVILKEVRIGLGKDSILNIFHPNAAELYSNINDLAKVCEYFTDTPQQLPGIDIVLFKPFRPMLSKRCDSYQFNKIQEPCMLYIETKFDGERFQLHMKDGIFKYFSRNGFDYTDKYGESYLKGIFTPCLRNVFKQKIDSIILDGEMMGWNKAKRKFGSKGMNFDVKKLNDDSVHQPCFCVFDILLLNGKILTGEPLTKRIELLRDLIEPKEGTLMFSNVMEAHCKQDLLDALNMSFDKEEEGIVFKKSTSTYKVNDRNAGWFKMKLEYFEGVMNDLDVIILGGYYYDSRQRKRVTGFLVGVAVSPEDSHGEIPNQFASLARIASGLNDTELQILERKLGKFWITDNFDSAKDFGILWGKEKPDVWIKPENSCILTVRGTELIKVHKPDFGTNYTLRFPRILKIREDKAYYDCMTTSELRELTAGGKAVEKLGKRHLYLEDIENAQNTSRPKKLRYQAPELVTAEEKTGILRGYEFCVLTGNSQWKKEEVQKEILENGGKIVLTESSNTFCILVGDHHPRINVIRETNAQFDVIKICWLRHVLHNGAFLEYEPSDAIHLSKCSQLRSKRFFDKYNDHYTRPATANSLQEVFEAIELSGDYINASLKEIDSLGIDTPHFFKYSAYFDKHEVINDLNSGVIYESFMDELTFRFYGGCISKLLNAEVNLVVTKCSKRIQYITEFVKSFGVNAKVVTREYIDCYA